LRIENKKPQEQDLRDKIHLRVQIKLNLVQELFQLTLTRKKVIFLRKKERKKEKREEKKILRLPHKLTHQVGLAIQLKVSIENLQCTKL